MTNGTVADNRSLSAVSPGAGAVTTGAGTTATIADVTSTWVETHPRRAPCDQHRRPSSIPTGGSEQLQRVMNLTTVRTHQYAVWITIGFFEVKRQGTWGCSPRNPQLAFDIMGPRSARPTARTPGFAASSWSTGSSSPASTQLTRSVPLGGRLPQEDSITVCCSTRRHDRMQTNSIDSRSREPDRQPGYATDSGERLCTSTR